MSIAVSTFQPLVNIHMYTATYATRYCIYKTGVCSPCIVGERVRMHDGLTPTWE